jgi:hypothetical protein
MRSLGEDMFTAFDTPFSDLSGVADGGAAQEAAMEKAAAELQQARSAIFELS